MFEFQICYKISLFLFKKILVAIKLHESSKKRGDNKESKFKFVKKNGWKKVEVKEKKFQSVTNKGKNCSKKKKKTLTKNQEPQKLFASRKHMSTEWPDRRRKVSPAIPVGHLG